MPADVRAGDGASMHALLVRDLLIDDREHVAGRKDQVLVGAELDLGAAVRTWRRCGSHS